MNTYPSLPQGTGVGGTTTGSSTMLVTRSGILARTATNGTVRPRAVSSANRYDPQVFHPGLTLAQVQSLQAFHEANRGVPFLFSYIPEGIVLTCIFAPAKPFDYVPYLIGAGTPFFDVTAYLLQSN